MKGQGGGPKTVRGRAAVRHNAVKHGLRSDDPVVTAHESPGDWKRHRDATIKSLAVEGHLETELAERIALLLWRLKRVARYETDMTNQYIQDIPDDMATAARYAKGALNIPTEESITLEKIGNLIDRRLLPSGEILERVMRYEAHLHRQLIQTLREIEALQARRNGQRPSPLARLDVSGSPL
ncbi:MAG: hypothetical protein ACRD1T_17865 [Acidimicrobiia bacterium]